MKKSLLVSAAALALAAATLVAPATVFAEDNGPAVGQSTAEFEVTAGGDTDTNPGGDNGTGDNANLWLVKAPDLNFGKATVADIIAGKTLTYTTVDGKTANSKQITDPKPDPAENNEGKLQVSDLRGNGAGWTLSAAITPFTADGATSPLNGTLNLKLTNLKADNVTATAIADQNSVELTTDNSAKTLWTATTDQGQGNTSADVDASTSLTINPNAQAKAAVYDATITWTLSSTITAG
ncbi:WxL domain-containing protein [Lacticaseibacillus suibinensis]|uniref:WxL domain-containing protein n=1 Tax=Lacticaseibacillus suibinensis TaxID=2486011 RepID=UPI000F7B5672|nr:WxL domain-containing protein [Lacticaseibacillus suibinensis]